MQAHYRPDIDGLRAIAVTLVIAFHLAPGIFPNGFIGVDIFFVISGYVVTLSVNRRNDPSVVKAVLWFWQRRFFRLYPALITCIAVTMLFVSALMPPFPLAIYNAYFRTGIASLIGVANLYLYRAQFDYFLSADTTNPFIHTWSLGIEEQFYFVFSMLFFVLPAFIAPRALTKSRIAIVATLMLGSMVASFWGVSTHLIANYLLLPYRFWELGIGCLLALTMRPVIVLSKFWRFARFGQSVGLILITATAVYPFGTGGDYSMLAIFLASLAAALIIRSGLLGGRHGSRVLSSAPMVVIGRGSYSLYLWHWPIFILFGVTAGLHDLATGAAAIAVVCTIATMSYFFIEAPFRSRNSLRITHAAAVGAIGAAVIGIALIEQFHPGFGFLGTAQNWSRDWLPDKSTPYVDGQLTAVDCNLSGTMMTSATKFPDYCIVHPHDLNALNGATIMLVGDSFAFSDWGMVTGLREAGFNLNVLSYDGCNIDAPDRTTSFSSCIIYWSNLPNYIETQLKTADVILVATYWNTMPGAYHGGAISTLTRIAEAAERVKASVVIQAPLPQFRRPAYLCTTEWFRTDYKDCFVRSGLFETSRSEVMNILYRFKADRSNVSIWDPVNLICDDKICGQFFLSLPLFRDTDHLSYYGARSLAGPFQLFLTQHVKVSETAPNDRDLEITR